MIALMNNTLLATEVNQTVLIVLMAVLGVLIILLAVLATAFIVGLKRKNEALPVQPQPQPQPQPMTANIVADLDSAMGSVVFSDAEGVEKETFNVGETVKATVRANEGYLLSSFTLTAGESVIARFKVDEQEKKFCEGEYEFVVTADTVVSVAFEDAPIVEEVVEEPAPEVISFVENFDGVGGGVVLTDADGIEKNEFLKGEIVRICAVADEGYYLSRFAIDDEEQELVEGVYEFVVTQPVKIDVHFEPIPVVEEVVEEPAPVVEEPVAPAEDEEEEEEEEVIFDGHNVIRFNKSFTAKLIQIDEVSNAWYTELKNELLSYKKVKDRMSWKRESFRFGKICVARFVIRGKTLCIQLPLDPTQFEDTKYKVEDISQFNSTADTPCLYRIKNERRVGYAKDLIAMVMEEMGTTQVEREWVDYFQPYDTTLNLIERQLVKKIVKFNGKTGFGGIVEKLTEDPTKAQESEAAATIDDKSSTK